MSTVSRVLRNHPDVKEETRQRTLAVISELGYRPSPIARALVRGGSKTVGLLMSDITLPFYPELARQIEQEAHRYGYGVLICNTNDSVKETRRYVERLLDQAIDGIIHASVGKDEEAIFSYHEVPGRIVFVNRRPMTESSSYVVTDNYRGGTVLTQHLLDLGHRRIGFISGPDYVSNVRDRLRGFIDTLSDAGEPLIVPGDLSAKSGVEAVRNWLRDDSLPTAIIGVTDSVALGALEALQAAGVSVPGDVAVAGFGSSPLTSSPVVSLTTVAQDIEAMSRKAVRLLLRLIEGNLRRPAHEVLDPVLHVRSTTAGRTLVGTIPG